MRLSREYNIPNSFKEKQNNNTFFIKELLTNFDEKTFFRELKEKEISLDKNIALFIIKEGYTTIVLKSLYRFVDLDKEVLLAIINDKHLNKDIFIDVSYFSGLDKEIFLLMLEKGFIKSALEDVLSFVDLDNEVAENIISLNRLDVIAFGLFHFKEVSIDVINMLLDEQYHEQVAIYLLYRPNLLSEIIDSGELSELNPYLLEAIERLIEIKDYERIYSLVKSQREIIKNLLITAINNVVVEDIYDLFDREFFEQNWSSCDALIKIFEILEITLPKEYIRSQVNKHNQQEQHDRQDHTKKRDIYGDIKLSKEIAEFYLVVSVGSDISQFEYQLRRNDKELTNRGVYQFTTEITLPIQKIIQKKVEWIKKYLLKAIQTELRFINNFCGNTFPDLVLPEGFISIDQVIEYATEEQIRKYIEYAIQKFGGGEWKPEFGGEAWKKISELALKFWSSDKEQDFVSLIDRVFQLEHNTGSVFDKDLSISFNPQREQKILDIKFIAKDFDELKEGLNNEFNEGNISSFAERLKARLEKIKNLPTQRRGYE